MSQKNLIVCELYLHFRCICEATLGVLRGTFKKVLLLLIFFLVKEQSSYVFCISCSFSGLCMQCPSANICQGKRQANSTNDLNQVNNNCITDVGITEPCSAVGNSMHLALNASGYENKIIIFILAQLADVFLVHHQYNNKVH